ncbi:polyprenol phosphomannose-dependent alpha 1,6 mannosyltransferase MptB [Microbacterium sp. ARD31]|uniref:polyprenol phosphomannose-dependent alpha 1,6 mannosyltransferase MptB n=1 Tax=Microbacterium sp. ARD31 TaxID=2962576 RepID=UPI0028825791|nr:polyprenol phosphomannose-dependent alpha 1,6 mannosyltransferase MptB [Microbacterium sp. ARD31]MDT0183638.1 polyprenol phosphomannose-dependent alpha 1,6 mannosyltransferase MptB [Microbacterium sp. ARD31]
MVRGLVGSVLVLLGGLVVATIPPSAAVAAVDTLALLRGTAVGRMAGLVVVLTGLGLIASAWLHLCRSCARADVREQPALLARVRTATAVWTLPLLLAPPLFSRDGWSYAAQGTLAHRGISPYEHGPWSLVGPRSVPGPIVEGVDARWMATPAPYGPVPLIGGDLAAGLTADPWLLVVAHRMIALVGLVLLAWAVPRLARWCGTNPALASCLVLASPLTVANGVAGLHNDLLMVGLMAAALVVAREHGWVAGAVLGGLAAGVKLPGGLACVAVVLVTLPAAASVAVRVRHAGRVAAVAVAALVLPGVVWGLGIGWLGALAVPGTVNTPLSLPTVVGGWLDLVAQASGAGTPDGTFLDLVRLGAQVGIVVVAGWVLVASPTGDARQSVRALALVTAATVALSPVVHLWYFLWAVPFVAVQRLDRGAMAALVALSLVAGLVAPMDSSLHGAYLAIVIGSLVVAAVAVLLLVTRRARERLAGISTDAWTSSIDATVVDQG